MRNQRSVMVTCQSHNLKTIGSIPASGKTQNSLKQILLKYLKIV